MFPEYYFNVPIDDSMICDSNVDLGRQDNVFDELGGNVANLLSLGYFSGYDAALDPYCLNLVDIPRKILWNNFFSFSYDFSMVFIFIKRALIYFVFILCMLFYLQACEPHAVAFDKLLKALTVSYLKSRVVKVKWSG